MKFYTTWFQPCEHLSCMVNWDSTEQVILMMPFLLQAVCHKLIFSTPYPNKSNKIASFLLPELSNQHVYVQVVVFVYLMFSNLYSLCCYFLQCNNYCICLLIWSESVRVHCSPFLAISCVLVMSYPTRWHFDCAASVRLWKWLQV
jgi:hypothetical protein